MKFRLVLTWAEPTEREAELGGPPVWEEPWNREDLDTLPRVADWAMWEVLGRNERRKGRARLIRLVRVEVGPLPPGRARPDLERLQQKQAADMAEEDEDEASQ